MPVELRRWEPPAQMPAVHHQQTPEVKADLAVEPLAAALLVQALQVQVDSRAVVDLLALVELALADSRAAEELLGLVDQVQVDLLVLVEPEVDSQVVVDVPAEVDRAQVDSQAAVELLVLVDPVPVVSQEVVDLLVLVDPVQVDSRAAVDLLALAVLQAVADPVLVDPVLVDSQVVVDLLVQADRARVDFQMVPVRQALADLLRGQAAAALRVLVPGVQVLRSTSGAAERLAVLLALPRPAERSRVLQAVRLAQLQRLEIPKVRL